ncbi:hypothetical protein Pflav_077060 [Phytohabitans flavus]|uniref:HTH-type transcriptional regulator MT1864/Rv1816-like C-terminal domain-containing protein n=1 Tax=Phytohabitans flavus TaxID=1076124 RepID=A0A6F8Y5A3_9ACTN|nr:hypothetical protein Pflav_077060 [Phytohabitans flavus]
MFGTPVPGYEAPAHTTQAATRTLGAFLEPIAALHPGSRAAVLEGQFEAGLADRDPDHPWSGPVLRLGVTGWTRMHGVVSLEVEGHFTQMGFDPGLLFEAEVESLIAEATGSEAG